MVTRSITDIQQDEGSGDVSAQGKLRLDGPLQAGHALSADALDRKPFARKVISVLSRVSSDSGLVVAVEGPWGCGKTSVLAMVEDLLRADTDSPKPVLVHFNPWLVGDRDALLGQFLSSLARAVKLSEHAKEGLRVAKELKTYAKAFDLLKLVPGAEPWASLVKSVIEATGQGTEALFDRKVGTIEDRKKAVEQALRAFPRRVIVFVDDVDRLYPAEAYEMVRIIKAVGELPNVGYVLAWDERYISAALDRANVPYASGYLDKVVQVRLPVPPLAFSQRAHLLNLGLKRLAPEALEPHFHKGDERLQIAFHRALSDLMEHPRDVARIMDVVGTIEPTLRGEIHIADIVGVATLMVKAQPVFELLRKVPQAFVGRQPGGPLAFREQDEVVSQHEAALTSAIADCTRPHAARELVHWLFPMTMKSSGALLRGRVDFAEGHLADPDRLALALHLSARPDDLSLVQVRRFIRTPTERATIAANLVAANCIDFVEQVGATAASTNKADPELVPALSLSLARCIENEPFLTQASGDRSFLELRPEVAVAEAISRMAKSLGTDERNALAAQLIADDRALSLAAELAMHSFYKPAPPERGWLAAQPGAKETTLETFANNVLSAAASGGLFALVDSAGVLRAMGLLVPARCRELFDELRRHDPDLDQFVEALLRSSFDSTGGQAYSLPQDRAFLESYVELEPLKELATRRLADTDMTYPMRAAWRAIVEEKAIYGRTGVVRQPWPS